MPILREQITTSLPIDEAFAFVADFGNSMLWDPGVASSEPTAEGPTGLGSRYRLGVRMRGNVVPMEYEITTFETPGRVVLTGEGTTVHAVDEIQFEAFPGGTRIDYTADIRLKGLLRFAEPFLGGAFAKIGRDALHGMRRALDERAAVMHATSDKAASDR
ncbi:MAG: SRPBCC family protein [Chloroflexota bacterium]